jgi:hypothetical protein
LSNGWVNGKGEVYFIFTREKMADMLGVSVKTAIKSVKQLEKLDLFSEERQGLNKPNLIYLCKPSQTRIDSELNDVSKKSKTAQNRMDAGVVNFTSQDMENLQPNKNNYNNENRNTLNSPTSSLGDRESVGFTFEKHDNIFKRVTDRYGTERASAMLDVVGYYIDSWYRGRMRKDHPHESKAKRMCFAEKLLKCADTLCISDSCVEVAIHRAISDTKDGNPTIYWATDDKVLGYWLIQTQEANYDTVYGTRYAPVEDAYSYQ